jgi:hypothetical protein
MHKNAVRAKNLHIGYFLPLRNGRLRFMIYVDVTFP